MVIIALDFLNQADTITFLDQFDEPLHVKVGMTLFYKEGPTIIDAIKKRGHFIFLDLKLHDIPNQVKEAMMSLASLNVDIVNVHAKGGIQMMKAALEGLTAVQKEKRPLLIGVTELTSTSKTILNEEFKITGEVIDSVLNLARLAASAGLDGVVSSPLEVLKIKEACGKDFLTVTPGIRYPGSNDDQVRVTTPTDAKVIGCDYIVVGRPITKAASPVDAYRKIKKEFMGE